MTTWQIVSLIVGLVLAIPLGTLIVALKNSAVAAKKAVADWKAAEVDGVITDAEKLQLADDAIDFISNASDAFQIIANFILAIKTGVTRTYRAKKIAKRAG